MEKITYDEMERRFMEYNKEHGNGEDGTYISGVVVFAQSNWEKEFTETERSYRVQSNNRAFQAGKISNSIFANCLDGKDLGVRLDWYNWTPEYCYMD